METRAYSFNNVDLREKNGEIRFRGHAAVFNSPTNMGTFDEVVRAGAFDRALAEGQDVLFTIDHNPEKLLARTSSGTLKLQTDAKGLLVEATLPNTSYARDAAELISRRDLSGMSFVFRAIDQEWTTQDNGRQLRALKDVNLLDVSVVALPAYKDTNADLELRAIEAALIEARAGKAISAANRELIRSAIETLAKLIDEEEEAEEEADPRALYLDLLERYS